MALAAPTLYHARVVFRHRALLSLALVWFAGTAGGATGVRTPPEIPLPPPVAPSRPADAPPQALPLRGQLLYENHCRSCHESQVYVRERRRAATPAALRAWVVRWAAELKLGWGAAEIDDVTDYLDRRYYHFSPASR